MPVSREDGIRQIPLDIAAQLPIVPVPMSHFACGDHNQQVPQVLAASQIRESPGGDPRANTVKRALGRIFLVIDPASFRPQFLPA